MFDLLEGMLKEELRHLRILQDNCFNKGVYATHLLLYDSQPNKNITFFTRIKGDQDKFYIMHGFDRSPSFTSSEIKYNAELCEGILISLGESGISINANNYFKISNGEIYLCDKKSQTRVEDLLNDN